MARTRPAARRLAQVARHLVAAKESEVEAAAADEFPRDEQRERLSELKKNAPRIDKTLSTWTVSELMQRSLALGASEAAVEAALDSAASKSTLIDLVEALEPPPPSTATVEMVTVDPTTTSVEEMAAILETVGVLIISGAADEATIAAVDDELELAGAWEISRSKEQKGRMQQEMLMKAPATRKLLTNEHVLAVTRHVLEPSCKRIALKELSAFEVQPGQKKQGFHREDMFWPWHHEPHPWSTNILWAIDDFTAENGGTNVIPYSHRSTKYMRENGREMQDGSFDEADVLKAAMPRGSVLLFTGGMIHGSGANETTEGRKSLLSSYQLGWLRPEYKFWPYRELHEAAASGAIEPELTELLGHYNNPDPTDPVWAGNQSEGMYIGRPMSSVEAALSDGGAEMTRPGLRGNAGYEDAGAEHRHMRNRQPPSE